VEGPKRRHLQAVFLRTWARPAWLSQSTRRRLGHERASKSCLNRQRAGLVSTIAARKSLVRARWREPSKKRSRERLIIRLAHELAPFSTDAPTTPETRRRGHTRLPGPRRGAPQQRSLSSSISHRTTAISVPSGRKRCLR
jgi:hypothetical protein